MRFKLQDILEDDEKEVPTANPFLDDEDDEGYGQVAVAPDDDAETTPTHLEDEPEDEPPLRLTQSYEADGSVITTVEVDEDAVRAELKAKRAAKRAQNHLDHPKWFRRSVTEKDLDFINFLVQHRYAKAEHLALIHGTRKAQAYKRLRGLEEYGFVQSMGLMNTSDVWFPTALAVKRSKFRATHLALNPRTVSWSSMPHSFCENYLAAAVLGANATDRDGKQLPFVNPLDLAEPEGWTTVSEYTLDRHQALGGEFARLYPHLDAAPPGTAVKKKPDLVLVKSDRVIAVEVEFHYKGPRKTQPLLNFYGEQEVFNHVVYVMPDSTDRWNMNNLIKKSNEDVQRKVRVLPLHYPDANGQLVEYQEESQFLYGK